MDTCNIYTYIWIHELENMHTSSSSSVHWEVLQEMTLIATNPHSVYILEITRLKKRIRSALGEMLDSEHEGDIT